ncbi:hypothetical protein [Streptomyces sp. NBC_01800]|uniref:hypothetical protein n=1 Tax=Streptomyces sp. NBC_01800 TaxID=2975945 RepID=UPI002DDB0483|nr:hypothetical protein [Streptomyces sp. NBC_01800]WSA67301.1 hypothetical protein OIE65_10100 [Streptomyces sp. NBC_01800]
MSVLVSDGPQGAWAWAGLRLEPEPAISENGARIDLPEAQRRIESASLEQVWLSQHWRPDGRSFEIRYVKSPAGGVSCTLLCRMYGADAVSASAASLALRDGLAVTPRHVRVEPIEDTGELREALVPLDGTPGGLAEVRKRLTWAWLSRRDTDFPLGVAVSPLVGEAVSWEPVWDALARQEGPTMIGVCLEPYAPPQDLLSYLGFLAREYGRLSQPGQPNPVFQRYVAPDPFALRAAPLYQDALRVLSGRVYRMRISLAATGAVPLHLAELLAATVSPLTATLEGGAVARVVPTQESAAAWANVTGLHRTWLDATCRQEVPQPLGEREKILADLVDLPQASAAFRFPYEIPGRPALFATRPRTNAAPDRLATAPIQGDPHAPTFQVGDPS